LRSGQLVLLGKARPDPLDRRVKRRDKDRLMNTWRHPNQRHVSELPLQLRRAGVPVAVRSWVSRCCGAAVVDVRRLPGASSTAVHAVRLADGRRLVLRRYVWEQFRREEPDAPERELAALDLAAGQQLPVPVVVAADVTGQEAGDGVPAILMTRVEGRAQPAPDLWQLAALAANVHHASAPGFEHHYFPWCRTTSTRPPIGCRDPDLWKRALQIWHTGEPRYRPRFIHRDFHPGNVLWRRGKLTGLVDWAQACIGPVGIDLATCRFNLADWAGPAAGDAFVSAYEQLSGQRHHPYWDIAKLVEDDWDLSDAPGRVAQAELLLADAMRRWNQRLT
jgi:aminoglycoside phosphotransferase (APT) family kinase protein